MLRIIGGNLRGRKLKAPKGLTTRPILARVREALFTVIGNIDDFEVLDLYAGTGAVGIEALSRGAKSSVFVDSGFRQCRTISENLEAFRIPGEVIRSDAERAIRKFVKSGRTFDFVFADPPYEQGFALKTLHEVCESGLLTDDGIFTMTVRQNEEIPAKTNVCEQIFNRRYGDTRLVIYRLINHIHGTVLRHRTSDFR